MSEIYAVKYDMRTKKTYNISTDVFETIDDVFQDDDPCTEPAAMPVQREEVLIDAQEFLSYPSIPGSAERAVGSIIENDDRILVSDTSRYPYKWIFYISVTFGTKTYRGTGFAIGGKLVMTCAHMVFDREANRWPDRLEIYAPAGNSFRRIGEAQALFRSYAYAKDNDDEWGLIHLSQPQDTGYMGMRPLRAVPIEKASVTGFPAEVREKETKAMWTERGNICDLDKSMLSYKIDTSDGNDGSPIHLGILEDIYDAYACGVHYAGYPKGSPAYNYGRVIDDRLHKFVKWAACTPNFDLELSAHNWREYYPSTCTFKYNGLQYLFAQSSSSRRWFIARYNDDRHDFEEEISSGYWGQFYTGIQIFSYQSRLYMFAQSPQNQYWFISVFNPQTMDFEEVVSDGTWRRSYSVVKIFSWQNQLYMFGHASADNRWSVSFFDPQAMNFEREISGGFWRNFYGSIELFEDRGQLLMVGQTQNARIWFVSKFSGADFEQTITNGEWRNYYDVLRVFKLKDEVCLFGHCANLKSWFISRYDRDTCDFEITQSEGRWRRYYGVAEIFTSREEVYLYSQSESDNRASVTFCRVTR